MKQRSISALGIAFVGLLPAIMGGPVWLIAFTLLSLIGYREYLALARRVAPRVVPTGYVLIPAFALATITGQPELVAFGLVSLAVALPFVEAIFRDTLNNAFEEWAIALAGVLYLGLPLFAAIQLRSLSGEVSATWLTDLADAAALDWTPYERGLAWLVTIILCTWLSDTFAYLVGRQFGRTKLSPVVSPNKTVEGFVGGLVAAAATGAIAFQLFGLDGRWWIGLLFGAAIAAIALIGDLSESVLKRTAGVKDSGNIIPGHGGMLDRLDALLFTFVGGWYLALMIDHVVL